MTTRLMDGGVRSPEAAQRLGLRGRDVYRLLFAGELDGGPGRDGMVYFDEASVDAYLAAHGRGDWSNIWSNEPRRTDPDDAGRTGSEAGSTDAKSGPDQDVGGRTRTRPDRPPRGPSVS
jgi:hypothetical protein